MAVVLENNEHVRNHLKAESIHLTGGYIWKVERKRVKDDC